MSETNLAMALVLLGAIHAGLGGRALGLYLSAPQRDVHRPCLLRQAAWGTLSGLACAVLSGYVLIS